MSHDSSDLEFVAIYRGNYTPPVRGTAPRRNHYSASVQCWTTFVSKIYLFYSERYCRHMQLVSYMLLQSHRSKVKIVPEAAEPYVRKCSYRVTGSRISFLTRKWIKVVRMVTLRFQPSTILSTKSMRASPGRQVSKESKVKCGCAGCPTSRKSNVPPPAKYRERVWQYVQVLDIYHISSTPSRIVGFSLAAMLSSLRHLYVPVFVPFTSVSRISLSITQYKVLPPM